MAKRTSYKDDVKPYLKRIKAWARDGATDEIIAQKLGISRSAFYKFKGQFVDFADALKKGKEDVDIQVENALLKRALGYEYTETVFEKVDGKVNLEITPDKMITTDAYKKKITIKQVVPDTTAQIFWLRNRRGDKWKNKVDDTATTSDLESAIKAHWGEKDDNT